MSSLGCWEVGNGIWAGWLAIPAGLEAASVVAGDCKMGGYIYMKQGSSRWYLRERMS